MVAQRHLEGIDETVQKTREWIDAITVALGSENERHGYVALRAVLHAIRDHLTVDEAAHLSAQLPMLVRGAFFEGWDPSDKPVRERTADQFLQRVAGEAIGAGWLDPAEASRVVAGVLRHHISPGEFEDVMGSLPSAVRELLNPS